MSFASAVCVLLISASISLRYSARISATLRSIASAVLRVQNGKLEVVDGDFELQQVLFEASV